jgi:hypothetical protein
MAKAKSVDVAEMTPAEKNELLERLAEDMAEAAADCNGSLVQAHFEDGDEAADTRDRQRTHKKAHKLALEILKSAEQEMVDAIMARCPYHADDVKVRTVTITLGQLVDRLESGAVDMAPPYQRNADLWSSAKVSQLFESMILRLPIPVFYVHEKGDVWAIVDGLQRCGGINRVCIGGMKLRGMEYLQELNGKKLADLPSSLKRRIDETQLTFHVVEESTPIEVVYNLFSRINTGGMKLSAQELRNALHQGPAIDALHAMTDDQDWMACTESSISGKRQVDMEFALRWYAFARHGAGALREYKSSDMNGWLNGAMDALNGEADIEQIRSEWSDTMQLAFAIWQEDAFRKPVNEDGDGKRTGVNKALFDSIGWALHLIAMSWRIQGGKAIDVLLESMAEQADQIKAEFLASMEDDEEYMASITHSTRDRKAVVKRFSVALRVLVNSCVDVGDDLVERVRKYTTDDGTVVELF